ncbi:MAG: DUF2279 domain-containing protein [Ignavibacteria bacterium]|nr:DUF2279 domain-containing protein [Ignavibacteria bacterium]
MKRLVFSPVPTLCVFHIFFHICCVAQVDDVDKHDSSDTTDHTVTAWKIGLVGGLSTGSFVVGHVLLNSLWWKGTRVDFHVNSSQDYLYSLNADKLGHLYFASTASTVYSDLFRWTGMDSAASAWGGAGVAIAYQTYIEIRDGFSADYGFSWGDMAANFVGASVPVLKHYYPNLRPLELQVSYWPSTAFRNGQYNAIIDDYTSATNWLAVSVYDYLPEEAQKWYPSWLGLAIGHSVENIDGRGGGNHTLYLSFDWNLQKIHGLPEWAASLLRVVHLYHLPAPAIKIYPNVVWYGLRF